MINLFPPFPGAQLEVVPKLRVKGIAPDGHEYDLSSIFGEWLDSLTAKQQHALMSRKARETMNKAEVQAFWQWAGRTDAVPASLQICLSKNPEFVNWILLARAFDFCEAKTQRSEDDIKKSLIHAFRNGDIRTRGIHEHDQHGHVIAMKQVELNTHDFVRWLDYECGIKTTKYAVACYPDDPTLFEVLWPEKKKKK